MIEEIKNKALENKVPIIKDEGLAYLLNLIKENNYKNILELGTAVGYSSINMAFLAEDIYIDTIERNHEMYLQAVKNIKEANLDKRINVYEMDIDDYFTDKKYDLIFVDAAKAQYYKYLNKFLDNLDENGVMFFDNLIFHGLIYEVDNIESRNLRNLVKKIIKFRQLVINDNRFDIMLYDNIGDGIAVLRRKK